MEKMEETSGTSVEEEFLSDQTEPQSKPQVHISNHTEYCTVISSQSPYVSI